MWTFKQYKNELPTIRAIDGSPTPASLPTCIALSLAALCCLVLFLPQQASAQRNDILEVKALKNEIRTRFSLSERDLVRIEPLIDQEGRKLLKTYVRFTGDEPEYSSRVWDQVIEDRTGFEFGLAPSLSKRQKEAVRSARYRMEKKVLGYLIDDYMNFLVQVLDLSSFQSTEMSELFASDFTKKTQLISLRLSDVPRLQKELDFVSEVTEITLKRIMTTDQWRMYGKLKENGTPIA